MKPLISAALAARGRHGTSVLVGSGRAHSLTPWAIGQWAALSAGLSMGSKNPGAV